MKRVEENITNETEKYMRSTVYFLSIDPTHTIKFSLSQIDYCLLKYGFLITMSQFLFVFKNTFLW